MPEGISYSRLRPQEQQAYKVILRAFESYSTEIDASFLPSNIDIIKTISSVLGDNPSFAYFDKTQIRSITSMWGKKYQLIAAQRGIPAAKVYNAVNQKALEIVSAIKGNTGNQYEQLLKAYEYLQDNVIYDSAELQACAKNGRSKNTSSHNAYGALMSNLAVCDGFASAFCLIAQKLGFECTCLSGKSSHRFIDFAEHSWNIIKINQKYYHIDITWDANQSREMGIHSFDYFLLDDDEISADHEWDFNLYPTCSYNDMNYFIKKGCFANNLSQVDSLFRSAIANNVCPVRIKLSQAVELPHNAEDSIAQSLADIMLESGKNAEIRYSWNEKTRCFFAIY